MKDPGKWNGSIDYTIRTKMEGIISRYQEEGKWIRWVYEETTKDLIKGYFWCPGFQWEKSHENIWIFTIIVPIPKYVIALVNTYLKYSFIQNISTICTTHTSINPS